MAHDQTLSLLRRWMDGEMAPPLKAILQPTHKCNLQCMFCGGVKERESGIDSNRELGFADWTHVVDDCAELGVRIWWVSGGGEPLMRRDVTMMILERAKSLDYETEGMLTTNGTMFHDRDIRRIVELGWDTVSISVEGPPDVNDGLRGRTGAFDCAARAIRTFVDYKRELGVEKPFVRFSSIFSNRIKSRIVEFVRLAHEVGCDGLSLNPLRMDPAVLERIHEADMPLRDIDRDCILSQVEEAKELARDLGFLFEFHGLPDAPLDEDVGAVLDALAPARRPGAVLVHPFLGTHCYEPFYSFIINYLGDVGPCCDFGNGYASLNVGKRRLKEIWYGPELEVFRSNLRRGMLSSNCQGCHLPFLTERYKKGLGEGR